MTIPTSPPARATHPVPPPTGCLARARLAGSAATAGYWLRAAAGPGPPGPGTVAAALDALGVLRTELRSLRPLLDKDRAVRVRAATDAPARGLAATHDLDHRIALLDGPGPAADPEARVLRAALARTRRRAAPAVPDAGLLADLDELAAGRLALRAGAPLGDPELAASVLLPPLLHRRFRKLVRDTDPADAGAVHRRAAELRTVLALAATARLEPPPGAAAAPGPGAVDAAAAVVLDAAAAVRHAGAAAELADRLPPGPARDGLAARAAAAGTPTVGAALAALGALRELLPVDTTGPAKRAAGGVLLRTGPGGPQVLLVHRVRQGDWTLPKGAVAPGESDVGAALREVREETGLRCRAGAELTGVRYRDRNRRAKRARYWLMTPLAGAGTPDPAEVDDLRWVPLADAGRWLPRERDRVVVAEVLREHGPRAGRRTRQAA